MAIWAPDRDTADEAEFFCCLSTSSWAFACFPRDTAVWSDDSAILPFLSTRIVAPSAVL